MVVLHTDYLQLLQQRGLYLYGDRYYALKEFDDNNQVGAVVKLTSSLRTNKQITAGYYITNSSGLYEAIQDIINKVMKPTIAVSIIFLLFTMQAITSFVSKSIAKHKKMIGTLRSMGVKNSSIFAIFASQSGFIAGISFVLAAILMPIAAPTLGVVFLPRIAFNMNFWAFLSMFGVMLLATAVAVSVPIAR